MVPPTVSTGATTTVPVDPFAIPEVIDAAYVNRVLAALYKIDGDLHREVLASGGVEVEVIQRLTSIYGEPQRNLELNALPSVLRDDPAIFRVPPGDRRVTVISIVTARSDCIITLADLSYAEVLYTATTIGQQEFFMVVLRSRSTDGNALKDFNPTPWMIVGARIINRAQFQGRATPCE
ncbi:MAG: hypothetical protein ACRD1K_06440 [Acidimicrobiales bacterium]